MALRVCCGDCYLISSPWAAAGSYGRELLEDGGEGLKLQPWQIALGVALTVGALAYIGRIAKDVRPFPCPPDL